MLRGVEEKKGRLRKNQGIGEEEGIKNILIITVAPPKRAANRHSESKDRDS